ncbi:recombinase RecT [Gaoshiqia sediminis]|uniref:Recombinase RecT n=1 Tax=Gaoshiqia sediminis TaxID=2986998 RepID=A0AA41Y630_9BACT|nr:RecT family recombinase [Gaoshiqia sediminis]MCW0484101.1 recombinase RecT [Gaoshiqia sediminis]
MANENNQVAEIKKDISAQVLAKIEVFRSAGELRIPKDYSPENALKSAYLVLTDPKSNLLAKCSKESVANALLKMVVWGLSPLKKQCDFIPYGDKLECSIEYTGNIVLAKRYGHLKNIRANAIFAGDTFEFGVDTTTGRKKIIKHEQTLDSIGSKDLKGAYAVFELEDGTVDVEIMSMIQIRDAWNQGPMKGNSPAHKNFPDQMACKTVINRACKLLIRASDDSVLYEDSEEKPDPAEAEKNEKANSKPIGFENAEEVDFEEQQTIEVKSTKSEETVALNTMTFPSLNKAKEFLINDCGMMPEFLTDEATIRAAAREQGIDLEIKKAASGPGF